MSSEEEQEKGKRLLDAAKGGNMDAVKSLLDCGAGVNVQNKGGWTALMFAAFLGHTEMARILLQKGADPGSRTGTGMTASDIATIRGNMRIHQLLKRPCSN